jgi:hypothetical protein
MINAPSLGVTGTPQNGKANSVNAFAGRLICLRRSVTPATSTHADINLCRRNLFCAHQGHVRRRHLFGVAA